MLQAAFILLLLILIIVSAHAAEYVGKKVMPISLGAPMDENPPDAEPIVIFTAT